MQEINFFWRQENLVIVPPQFNGIPSFFLVFLDPQSFLVESAFESFICIHCRFSTKHLDSADEKDGSNYSSGYRAALNYRFYGNTSRIVGGGLLLLFFDRLWY